ncbi:MAG: NTP transferase domain-containing protein [bacterium]|nr:NTP transferase domain-containing protein [bacterium]
MKAIILAGGLGERLRPFTQAIPKPLLPIGEQSLLEVQVANLVKYGFDEIYIATNYKSEYIENFMGDGSALGAKITYSREDKPLGTCGPVGLLRDELDEPFILMNGDILTTIDYLRFHRFGMGEGTDFAIATKNIGTPFNFGSVQSEGNRVIRVDEKPEFLIEVVAGIYFMSPALLELIPRGSYFGIDDLITRMLAENRPIARYLMEEYWLDIGRIEDYSVAEEAYQTHFAKKPA